MNISIGEKIKELRIKASLTQTELSEALGVSPQAVSRWEIGATYPDLELLPPIANYFGVTIDELFGCESDREAKIGAIIAEASSLAKYDNGIDVNIEKRLTLLRNGLVEFPKNERLMYELASTLSNAGWVRLGERIEYIGGFLVHSVNNRDNEYWKEAIKLYEALLSETKDPQLISDATYELILLYNNMGQSEKGLALAEKAPPLHYSREMLMEAASDGAERHEYLGRALLRLSDLVAETTIQLLMSKESNFDGELALKTVSGIISLFDTLIDDGNFGPYHARICDLYMYLSEHQWRAGFHDKAFESLDKALEHSKAIDRLSAEPEEDPKYTSQLLKGVSMEKERWADRPSFTSRMPEDFPMWMKPDFEEVKSEMTKDPRWDDWSRRAKE